MAKGYLCKYLSRPSEYMLWLLAILSSVFCGLAWCSAWFGWLLFVAIVPLLLIVTLVERRSGWMHGLCYIFFAFLLWLVMIFWWISCVTLLGFFFVMFFIACCLFFPWLIYYCIRKWGHPYVAYLGLITAWLTLEYVHLNGAWWEFTCPWLNLGNGLIGLAPWIQWYAYTGILGGSLWILVANILLYHLLWEASSPLLLKSYCGWLLLPIGFSLLSYFQHKEQGVAVEAVVVQPNFSVYTEKNPSSTSFVPERDQLDRLLALSKQLLTPETTVVVWPESAVGSFFNETCINDYVLIQPILQFVAKYGRVNLITGAASFYIYGNKPLTKTAIKINGKYLDHFNSILHFRDGHKVAIYRKTKRLPGAEYIPYFHLFPKPVLHWIKRKFAEIGDIEPGAGEGTGAHVFTIDQHIKVAPVNCYESLYGAFVGEACRKGATLLAVATNDGWWGNTPIYHHHFQYSRLLAIAHRRSVMRAANTGISGFINQRGDVITQTNRLTTTAIAQQVYANPNVTFYSLYGDYIGRIAVWIFLALFFLLFLYRVILCSGNVKPITLKSD